MLCLPELHRVAEACFPQRFPPGHGSYPQEPAFPPSSTANPRFSFSVVALPAMTPSVDHISLHSLQAERMWCKLPFGSNVNLYTPQVMRGGGVVGIRDPEICNGLITGVVGFGGGVVNLSTFVFRANQLPLDRLMNGNGELSPLSLASYTFRGGLRGRKHIGNPLLPSVFDADMDGFPMPASSLGVW